MSSSSTQKAGLSVMAHLTITASYDSVTRLRTAKSTCYTILLSIDSQVSFEPTRPNMSSWSGLEEPSLWNDSFMLLLDIVIPAGSLVDLRFFDT